VLAEQTYSPEDDLRHFDWLVRAFEDDRYIRVEGRPLFLVWRAHDLPDPRRTTDLWRREAARRGIGELCLARVESFSLDRGDPTLLGFDIAVEFQPDWRALGPPRGRRLANRILARTTGIGRAGVRDRIYSYDDVVERMLARPAVSYPRFPCVTPAWDNTARRATDGVVLHGSTPDSYGRWLTETLARLASRPPAQRLLFINAWNEWAEGSHLEPDRRFRRGYLEATEQAVAAAEAAPKPRP
jgi:lipopolysaccharide biosynthesis protein